MPNNFIINDKIEIFYKDLPRGRNWNQYVILCKALRGEGWRLPTIEELSYMCELSKLGVLEFANEYYWSSELNPKVTGKSAYLGYRECIYFPGGARTFQDNTITGIYARPVRDVIHL